MTSFGNKTIITHDMSDNSDLERKFAMKYTFEDYRRALEGAGPRLAEIILDRAAQDRGISLLELTELVNIAYPEAV